MKLSTRARYALRSMIQIARMGDGGNPVSLSDVSKRTSISRRYLEQLAISLKNAQLLRGVSGKNGGYVLTRPADQIKIGDIVAAAIGPINIVDCVSQPESCLMSDICECRPVYVLINNRITEVLDEFSLADLLDKKYLETRLKLDDRYTQSGAVPSKYLPRGRGSNGSEGSSCMTK